MDAFEKAMNLISILTEMEGEDIDKSSVLACIMVTASNGIDRIEGEMEEDNNDE